MVCDLESASNSQKYDDVLLSQSKPKMYTAIIEKAPNKKNSDEYISWTNQKPQSAGWQPRSAVIIGPLGPTAVAKQTTDAKSSWVLFFSQKNSGNCGKMYKPTHRKGKTKFKFKQQNLV